MRARFLTPLHLQRSEALRSPPCLVFYFGSFEINIKEWLCESWYYTLHHCVGTFWSDLLLSWCLKVGHRRSFPRESQVRPVSNPQRAPVMKGGQHQSRLVRGRHLLDRQWSRGPVGSTGSFWGRKESLDLALGHGSFSFMEYGFGHGRSRF